MLRESVLKYLKHPRNPDSRRVLSEALRLLSKNPREQTRNLKTLRPNPIAESEMRLGKYRVLFNVDDAQRQVIIVLVGEKQGNVRLVQGRRFTGHENHFAQ